MHHAVQIWSMDNAEERTSASSAQGATKHRSMIWEFSNRSESHKSVSATCYTCKAILKTLTQTTTTLVCHLVRHFTSYSWYKALKKPQAATKQVKEKTACNDTKLSEHMFQSKLSLDSVRAKASTKAGGMFVPFGLHPYSIVEEPAFQRLMNSAAPDYQMLCRTTLSRAVIPELYNSACQRVNNKLQALFMGGVGFYSLTTDCWTAHAGNGCVSLTCHLLNDDFKSMQYAIMCKHMLKAHTGENLRTVLEELTQKWKLPCDNSAFIATGNAINFVSMLEKFQSTRLQCLHIQSSCAFRMQRRLHLIFKSFVQKQSSRGTLYKMFSAEDPTSKHTCQYGNRAA